MEKQTIWTNQFDQDVADKVDALLEKGFAVRVGASCIGHTRAHMVESGAKAHFRKLQCREVQLPISNLPEWEGYTETYYVL